MTSSDMQQSTELALSYNRVYFTSYQLVAIASSNYCLTMNLLTSKKVERGHPRVRSTMLPTLFDRLFRAPDLDRCRGADGFGRNTRELLPRRPTSHMTCRKGSGTHSLQDSEDLHI
jgi:hypothetical protein